MRRRLAVGAGLSLGAALGMSATAEATDYTVTNLTDGAAPGPAGSLRNAVTQSEANPGADRVLFQSGLTGTITLTNGALPQVFDPLEILGGGANVTIAGSTNRILVFSSGYNVRIADLTLSGGTAGGGYGGAIISAGVSLTIEGCTISGATAASGGALSLGGPTTITNSTISGNHANSGSGGGIWTQGDELTIQGSTFSGNTATSQGAGIYAKDATAQISHSTISGNSGAAYGGGVWSDGGTLTVEDSTVAGNSAGTGGGITSAGHPTDPSLVNTIVADNTATYGPDLNSAGSPDEPFNVSFGLVENTSDAVINETVGGSNITGQDPQLGPLQENGGPTKTRAPAATSPVVDKGSSAVSFDQRGNPRIFDFPAIANSTAVGANAADIGAVEQAAPQDFTVTLSTDGPHLDPGTTLREAIEHSENENLTGRDRILFAPGVTGTISLGGQQLPQIHEPLEIVGPGAGSLSISGGNASRILSLDTNPGDDVKVSGLTLTQGNPGNTVRGGAVLAQDADLTVEDATISDSAAQDGGALFFNGSQGSLELRDSTISGNDALPGGTVAGGIWGYDIPMTVEGSTFSGNTAPTKGGGLYFGGYDGLTVTNSTFSGNTAPSGAGIEIGYAFPTAIRSSTIADNTGSGIHIYQANPAVTNSIVAGNTGGDLVNTFFDSFGVSFSLVENGAGVITTVPDSNIFGEDPELGPLASNGGPTQTQRPQVGSPVIDQGKAGTATTDQRGLSRPLDVPSLADSGATGHDSADMGAVELTQAEALPPVVTPPTTPPAAVPAPAPAKKKCKKAKKRAAASKKKCKKKK